MRDLCDASYQLIVPITIIGELTCCWTKTPRNSEEYSRSPKVKLSRRQTSAVCIIVTNAGLRDRISPLSETAGL